MQLVILLLRARLRSLSRAGFMHSVGVLAGGTAFAQALGVLVLPVVTRLYTPADFTVLAVFASILSIVSVAACFRLEIAIPLPESDRDAANLLALALCICTLITALAGVFVWWVPAEIAKLLGQPALRSYLWLLIVGIWLAGACSAVQFWSTRKQRFEIVAKTRVTQAVGAIATQMGLGWLGWTPLGLLLGQVISSGAGLFGMGRGAICEDRSALRSVSGGEMYRMLRQYERFPKYSTFEAFANSAAIQLPLIVIAAIAAGPEAGYLALAMRVIGAPMGLIGGAVSQVYLSRAPGELRAGTLTPFTLKIMHGLARSGGGILICIGIAAPSFFPIVFGESWRRAGCFVLWMTPWFVVQFLTSPVSMALHVTENQRSAMVLQLTGLFVRVGAIVGAAFFAKDFVVEVYAVSGFLFYLIYFLALRRVLEISKAQLIELALTCLKFFLPWGLAGWIGRLALS